MQWEAVVPFLIPKNKNKKDKKTTKTVVFVILMVSAPQFEPSLTVWFVPQCRLWYPLTFEALLMMTSWSRWASCWMVVLDVGESSHLSSNQGPSVFLVLGSVSPGPWSQRSCRLVTHLDRFHGKAPVREAPNLEKKIKLLLSKFVVYSYGLRVYMFIR